MTSMWIGAGLATAIAALVSIVFLIPPGRRTMLRGSWDELRDQLAMLAEGRAPVRGLRIEIVDTGRALNVLRGGDGLELRLPAASSGERMLEGPFRMLCREWGLVAAVRRGPGGRRNLGIPLPGTAAPLIDHVERVLRDVHGAPADATFRMIHLH